jgi:hypothetical protein
MAKQRHQDTEATSSKNTLIVMAIGGVLVAALVFWALTRTVEAPISTTTPSTAQFPTTTAPTPTGTGETLTATAPITSVPTATPPASTSAPLAIPPSGPIGDKASVPRIAAEDVRERLNAGAITVIDVRDANSYAAGHIPGAMHIQFASMEGQVDLIPKGKPIVTYCT